MSRNGSLAPASFEVAFLARALRAGADLHGHAAGHDGQDELVVQLGAWTLGWTALFYLLSLSYPWWSSWMPLSGKPHENNRHWCARNVLGTIHAAFVSALSVPALVMILRAPGSVQFGDSQHLATCRADESQPELHAWDDVGQAIALAGLAFATFTLADIVILLVHGLATADYMVHHAAFLVAAVIIRGHCMLPLNSAVLMSMEVSTPFLNYMALVRHRGDGYRWRVIVCGTLFVITFLITRIGLNTYGTVMLWSYTLRGIAEPQEVPVWQRWLLLVAVTAGAGVQLLWLPGILNSFVSRLWMLVTKGECATGEDSEGTRSPASSAGAEVALVPATR